MQLLTIRRDTVLGQYPVMTDQPRLIKGAPLDCPVTQSRQHHDPSIRQTNEARHRSRR